jgi:hypothetical protein
MIDTELAVILRAIEATDAHLHRSYECLDRSYVALNRTTSFLAASREALRNSSRAWVPQPSVPNRTIKPPRPRASRTLTLVSAAHLT